MRQLHPSELLKLAWRLIVSSSTMRQAPFLSRAAMRAWQLERIQTLVWHAYEKVPFYRELYGQAGFEPGDLKTWTDFERLPLVTKDQIIANYPEKILAAGTDPNELIVSRSSGSSGKVLDIAYSHEATITYILAGLRLYKMGFPYLFWHRQLYVYTSRYPLNSLLGLYPLHFVSTLAPIEELVAELEKRRPALLVCYPSHLMALVAESAHNRLKALGLRLISVNSEMSTQTERDYLASVFGCPVLDEYSSEELTRIAAQCLHKSYHIFEDINYIEVLPDLGSDSQAGTIIGTNLHNFCMPMIRYRQDDRGQIDEQECPCGWHFRKLTNFEGRKNDSFTLPSGKTLSSGFLLDASYEFLLTHRSAIKDFCLIQRSLTEIVLQVVPAQGWSSSVADSITARFMEFLEKGVNFQLETVNECYKTKTGKRNPIINLSR